MAARYVVFFLAVLALVGSAHYYLWMRLVRDTGIPAPWSRVLTVLLGVLFALIMTGFLANRVFPRSVATPISYVAYTWLGAFFLLLFSTLASDAVKAVYTRVPGLPDDPERRQVITRIFGGAAAVLGLGASTAGLASVLSPVAVAKVKVTIDRLSKSASGYRIAQLTDVHVGPTIGKEFIEAIVATTNALGADMVVITGDLVDGSVESLREHVAPLGKLKAKDGVFFVTGNHEYYSGADAWIGHLRELGIRVLRNEHVRIRGDEGFDLAGIDDHTAFGPGHGSDLAKALAGRDSARVCVLLAHQPRGIDLADSMGVDLQLSGHTHGGQIFPWNFFVRLQQPFVAGLHKLTKAQIYVSRGTGYWGPPMRVGAPAEITEIELRAPGA